MMRPLGNQTITIVKPTVSIDTRDNTTVISFDPPSSTIVVDDCNLQPFLISEKLNREITGERDYARSTWRVWMPPTSDTLAIEPRDRVIYDGEEYEIFGHIAKWPYFNGTIRHVQFVIELRQG